MPLASPQPLQPNPAIPGPHQVFGPAGPTRSDDPAPLIAREGWGIVLGALAVAIALSALTAWLPWCALPAALAWLLVGFCCWFFRDPQRAVPIGAGLVLSPADGVVLGVDHVEPPEEVAGALGLPPATLMARVAIFLNVFNVHVNRVPVPGIILKVETRAGGFAHAGRPEANHNRRCSVAIRTPAGAACVVTQVTGWIARRIVCRARAGQSFRPGERYGLIRFGSRTDVYLPLSAAIEVLPGQRVTGGVSVLARGVP